MLISKFSKNEIAVKKRKRNETSFRKEKMKTKDLESIRVAFEFGANQAKINKNVRKHYDNLTKNVLPLAQKFLSELVKIERVTHWNHIEIDGSKYTKQLSKEYGILIEYDVDLVVCLHLDQSLTDYSMIAASTLLISRKNINFGQQ